MHNQVSTGKPIKKIIPFLKILPVYCMEVVKMNLKKCNLYKNYHSIMVFSSRDVNAFSVCSIDVGFIRFILYTNTDM